MIYRIERWSPRGITVEERATKNEANALAAKWRGERDVQQTIVIKPNGDVRVCRNPLFTGGKQ